MSSNYPPFVNATGLIEPFLRKISEAGRPARFTQDFLSTKLGFTSSSARPLIGLLKRLGFLQSDGVPTELYSQFRNSGESKNAMALAIRSGYAEVYERNEYAHELNKDRFRDLIMQITGLEKGNSTVAAIVGTFFSLKEFSDFDGKAPVPVKVETIKQESDFPFAEGSNATSHQSVKLNLGYTINLNLPETTNVEVFNAIFRSLRENLLRD